jgi:hypothetical protein
MIKEYRLESRMPLPSSEWQLSWEFNQDQYDAFRQFVDDMNPPDAPPRLRIATNLASGHDVKSD